MLTAFLERSNIPLGDLENSAKLLHKGGGAGKVLKHPSLPDSCIKLYKTPELAALHADKVAAMIAQTPNGMRVEVEGVDTVQFAWPIDRVVNKSGQFLGFTMPLIDVANAWTGKYIIHPRLRSKNNIPNGQRVRLVVALNVAKLIQQLHNSGHYVIDLKPENFRVYNKKVQQRAGYVAMLDCDGFHVRDRQNGRTFRAATATPEYLNARAFAAGINALDWANDNPREQDLWAAATLFFQLLNEMLHPMQGRLIDGKNAPTSNEGRLRNAAWHYPYGRIPSDVLQPDKDSIHAWMDDALRDLFDQTFLGLRTPAISEWIAVLNRLNDDRQRCLEDVNHWRLGSNCALCDLEAGRSPPGSKQTGQVSATWQKSAFPTARPVKGSQPGAVLVRPSWRRGHNTSAATGPATTSRQFFGRNRYRSWFVSILAVVTIVLVGRLVPTEQPDRMAVQQSKVDVSTIIRQRVETSLAAISKEARSSNAVPQATAIAQSGLAAVSSGDFAKARKNAAELELMLATLRQIYDVLVVSRPGTPFGVLRIHNANNRTRNYYLVVEAIGPNGKAIPLPVTSEEDRTTETVSQWGVRVSKSLYDRIARDKKRDGKVDEARIGVKQRGYLDLRWTSQLVKGGRIHNW